MIKFEYIFLPLELKDFLKDHTSCLKDLRDHEKLSTILTEYDLVFYNNYSGYLRHRLSIRINNGPEAEQAISEPIANPNVRSALKAAEKALTEKRLKLHVVWDPEETKETKAEFQRYGQPYIIIEEVEKPLAGESAAITEQDVLCKVAAEVIDNYPELARKPDVDPITVAFTSLYM